MKRQIVPTLAILAILVGLGCYADSVAHDTIINAIRITVIVLSVAVILVTVAFVLFFILSVRERVLTRQANRKLAQREADVYTLDSQHGVYVREMNPDAVWRPLHLYPTAYQNGSQSEVSSAEMTVWQLWTLRNRPQVKEVLPELLPATTPQTVDLLAALDGAQCALIVGPRDSGKTTILQHVIARRLDRSHVLVLDPHSHPTRWPPGCKVVGTERNFQMIENALKALLNLMNERYREIGKGLVREGEHPSVTVIIDEWRAIVYQLGRTAADIIKTLLAESRKTNIDVFVGAHSERVKALGIEGEGDLKDGFVMVRLTINKMTKERKATIDYGEGEIPATLPGPFAGTVPQILESDEFINLEVEPSPTEAFVLNLYEQGESISAIARQVFGSKGGNQNQRVKEILAKYEGVRV
jgi:hypothetical protein